MNKWSIHFIEEAKKEYKKLDGSVKKQVLAGIIKVSQAPLPSPNGYGKPLGKKKGNNLTGFFKIKYRGIGIRVVYTLVLEEMAMNIVVISERDDEHCYELAAQMYEKYGEKVFMNIYSGISS